MKLLLEGDYVDDVEKLEGDRDGELVMPLAARLLAKWVEKKVSWLCPSMTSLGHMKLGQMK